MDSMEVCSDLNDTPILAIERSESESLSIEASNAMQAINEIQKIEHSVSMDMIAMEYSPNSSDHSLKVKLSPDVQNLSDIANTPFNSLKRQCTFNDIELGNRKKRLTLEEETFLSLDRSCNAMLNGNALQLAVDGDNESTSSPSRGPCVDTFEAGDCGNPKGNCILSDINEDGSSTTITAASVINTENSLADEFAEFMASAFVSTSCSRKEEPSADIILEIKCNGSKELVRDGECNGTNELVPDDECNGSNELPEDKCSGSNELTETRNSLKDLYDGESNGSNELVEEKYKGSNESPKEEDNGSSELLDECNDSKELPEKECTDENDSNQLPQNERDGTDELPEEDDSNQLTGSVDEYNDFNELPVKECNGSKDLLKLDHDNSSSELPEDDDYESSKKSISKRDDNSAVPSITSVELAEIVSGDSLSSSSASDSASKSESKDNQEKGNNCPQDNSEISDFAVIPESVTSLLEPLKIDENHVIISDVPVVDGHSPTMDRTMNDVCDESKKSRLSPEPPTPTSTHASNSVDLDLGVDDVGVVQNGFSTSVSQCSVADNAASIAETNENNLRRSARKLSKSERASTVIEIVVNDTPKKSGRAKGSQNVNNRGGASSNSPNISPAATVASQSGRPVGKFLIDIGLQIVTKQIYKDLINIQKVRMHTNDAEADQLLLDKLVVSHKKFIDMNKPFKCGPALRCRCQFMCNSANVLEYHREHGWEDSSGKIGVFRCCYCDADASFHRECSLVKHMKVKHDRNYRSVTRAKHECYFCKYETSQAATMISHRRTCVRQFQLKYNLEPNAEDRDIPLVEVLKKGVPKNQPSYTPVVKKNVNILPKQVVTVAKQAARNPSYLQPRGAFVGGANSLAQISHNGVISNVSLLTGPAMCVSRASLSQGQRQKAPIIIVPAPIQSHPAPILSTMQVCPICNGIVKDATVMAMHMQVCHPNVNVATLGGPIPTVVSEMETGTCYLCRPPRTFINQSFLQQHIACQHSMPKQPTKQVVLSATTARSFDVTQLRTRCRMCFAMISGNPMDHMSSMHMITLWMMLKRCFCYLCPDEFEDVARFESHMVCAHTSIFPTQETLWTRIQPTIPTTEIRRAGLDKTLRKFGEIQCPRCDARHLSRVALYRHYYLEHGFGIVSKPCSICKVFVEDELSHMLEAHVRACTVLAIRLNDDTFQKYYDRYLKSLSDDDALLNMHHSRVPLGTIKMYPTVVRPPLSTVKPPLGTVIVKPYNPTPTVIRAPVRVVNLVAHAAVTATKQPQRRTVVTLRKTVPRRNFNPSPRVLPKVNDDTVIILDDDDDDDDNLPIEKPATQNKISAARNFTHESVVLTSDDSDEDEENSADDNSDSSNKDDVQDVWDDGELVYNKVDDGGDTNHHVIDCNVSQTSSKSSESESDEDVPSDEDVEELNLDTSEDVNDSEDKPNDSVAPCPDGVYPLHMSSMVPSPCSQSPSPSEQDDADLEDQKDPSSPAASEHMEEEEEVNSDVDMDNMVMEIDDETIVIVNEDSD